MLHSFQEQLILSQSSIPVAGPFNQLQSSAGLISSRMSAIVDLQQQQSAGGSFREPFYTLVAEKTPNKGVMMHMWRLVVASEKDESEGEVMTWVGWIKL